MKHEVKHGVFRMRVGDSWIPYLPSNLGGQLWRTFNCVREAGNIFDLFVVAVVRDGKIICHVPRLISAACLLFLQNSSSIKYKVTGSRQYSRDLLQGGLEIPCTLMSEGNEVFIEKIKKSELDLDKSS